MKLNKLTLKCIRNEKGISLIFIAISIFVLLAFVGFGVDLGYMYLVKGQLQNAADAGALAGTGVLYPKNSSSLPSTITPDWTSAQSAATTFIKKNNAAGATLADADIESVQVGYWNLKQIPSGMQPYTTIPKGICSGSGNACTSDAGCNPSESCLIQDVPAVQVTLKKSGVSSFFARVLGWTEFSARASAVAATGYPDSGIGLFPVALTKCMVDSYFTQNPLPTLPPEIYIYGPYGPGVSGNVKMTHLGN